MTNLLENELKTYDQQREALLGTAEGKFVLIHDHEVFGVFDTDLDAINSGYQQFGNVPFLVKHVLRVDEPVNFTSNLIGT